MRAKPVQQGDEPRAALIDDAEFAFDIRADLARRARQDFSDPGLQRLFLHLRQARGAAAAVKARQTFEPVLQEQRMPAPDAVVVEKSAAATRSQLQPSSSRTRAFARRAKRCAAEPSRTRAIRSARSSDER